MLTEIGAGMSYVWYRKLVWVHMLPGLTQGKCSMVGAWGPALDPTSPTQLLQLRALGTLPLPCRTLP